jgi:tRNA(adenine34) deaminase
VAEDAFGSGDWLVFKGEDRRGICDLWWCVRQDQAGRVLIRLRLRNRSAEPLHVLGIVPLQARRLGDWRLTGCTLAVTLEPCPMCAGAILLARIDRLVYGAADPKAGAVETLYRICSDERLNHRVEVAGGIRADECAAGLTEFFRRQREMGKK